MWTGSVDHELVGLYNKLSITNHKWFNSRIQPYFDLLEEAIRQGQKEVTLPLNTIDEVVTYNTRAWYAYYATTKVSNG